VAVAVVFRHLRRDFHLALLLSSPLGQDVDGVESKPLGRHGGADCLRTLSRQPLHIAVGLRRVRRRQVLDQPIPDALGLANLFELPLSGPHIANAVFAGG
jgi:hypothetical protein